MLVQERYDRILIDRRDNGVVVATLNRPEKLNAIDAVMHTELTSLTQDAHRDASVRVLVLTGAGRAFSAGGDFSGVGPRVGEWDGAAGDVWTEARMIVDRLLECSKPIIAAVNGHAAGLGATIALLCDVVVAGPDAVFADTHVRVGIGAGDGGQVAWPFLVGMSRAKYHLMTGEPLRAAEAERLGLVTFLADDCLGRAMEIADRLAAGPPVAIAASKVPINTWLRAQAAQILTLSLTMEELSASTNDAHEARLAFQEKRPATFTGS
jgi:enoyl-CoA hydratase